MSEGKSGAETSESLSQSLHGCGGDNLGSAPRNVAAARRELAPACPWCSPCLNSIQKGWVHTLGVVAFLAKLWPQARWEGKQPSDREDD